ncbi:MAG: alpha/beta hydrolase [Rhodocyclaceae bacterium]|nr:alpha/beta hydrolase [Rhodocyclaceae bacterium]
MLIVIALLFTPVVSAQSSPAPRAVQAVSASEQTIELWPTGAEPLLRRADALPLAQTIIERGSPTAPDRALTEITRPHLAVFRAEKPNGAAVLIAPGGGYRWVVIDREGFEIARWLAARGVTTFVLFYRLPSDGWMDGPDTPFLDAQRAMRVIRHRAEEFHIDPARVAAMGFSAGGHLVADLTTRFDQQKNKPFDAADRLSARPFLSALLYPVISMQRPVAHAGSREKLLGSNPTPEMERRHSPNFAVSRNTPPCFLLHAEDDTAVPIENTLLFRAALAANKVPSETHLYATGGHGFGMSRTTGKPVADWQELFLRWARGHGWY